MDLRKIKNILINKKFLMIQQVLNFYALKELFTNNLNGLEAQLRTEKRNPYLILNNTNDEFEEIRKLYNIEIFGSSLDSNSQVNNSVQSEVFTSSKNDSSNNDSGGNVDYNQIIKQCNYLQFNCLYKNLILFIFTIHSSLYKFN